jgi:hypothetical protein
MNFTQTATPPHNKTGHDIASPQEFSMNSSSLGLDCVLISQVRTLMDGANVHAIKTWLFCYEISPPNSARRERYEELLREWLATKRQILAARAHAKSACHYSTSVRAASDLRNSQLEAELLTFGWALRKVSSDH